jgi:hypothetical protein
MLTTEDILAIHQLVALYGHIIDERQFSRVHELFTESTVYDVSDFGMGVHVGTAAIAALWLASEEHHPLAHHATNIVVSEDPDGTVRVISKGIGIGRNGRAGSVTYRDVVICTADGWRIAERIARLRRAETIPAPG